MKCAWAHFSFFSYNEKMHRGRRWHRNIAERSHSINFEFWKKWYSGGGEWRLKTKTWIDFIKKWRQHLSSRKGHMIKVWPSWYDQGKGMPNVIACSKIYSKRMIFKYFHTFTFINTVTPIIKKCPILHKNDLRYQKCRSRNV